MNWNTSFSHFCENVRKSFPLAFPKDASCMHTRKCKKFHTSVIVIKKPWKIEIWCEWFLPTKFITIRVTYIIYYRNSRPEKQIFTKLEFSLFVNLLSENYWTRIRNTAGSWDGDFYTSLHLCIDTAQLCKDRVSRGPKLCCGGPGSLGRVSSEIQYYHAAKYKMK